MSGGGAGNSHRAYAYCVRGKPIEQCDKRFTFAYIFAAVEPGTDIAVAACRGGNKPNAPAPVVPYLDTDAMQQFLDRFAATIGKDEHVAMVLDRAG